MAKKNKKSPSKPLLITLALLLVVGGVLLLKQPASEEVELASESRATGEFYIDPDSAEINMASSETFISYTHTSTDDMPTRSDWTVLRDGEEAHDIALEDCEYSSECTVYTGDIEGDLTLTATTSKGKEASANIEVNGSVEVDLGFSDEVPDWAAVDIAILNERGIMMGYSDGSFGADDPVTRGQFITLLYRLMPFNGFDTAEIIASLDCDVYTDVPATHYAYEGICFASHIGWLTNIPSTDGKIKPDEALTRTETAELFAESIGRPLLLNYYVSSGFDASTMEWVLKECAYIFYTDVNSMTPYASGIGAAAAFSVMQGTDELFRPNETLNRAETAVIVWRILSSLLDGASEDIEINIDEDILEAAIGA